MEDNVKKTPTEIKCFQCGKDIGIIQKGQFRKSAKCFCNTCWEEIHQKLIANSYAKNDNGADFMDMFGSILGGKRNTF